MLLCQVIFKHLQKIVEVVEAGLNLLVSLAS